MSGEWKTLAAALAGGNEEERRFAAEDLGDLGDPEAVPSLVAALEDRAVAVREAAADALMACADGRGAILVADLLASESAPVRNYAQEILASLGSTALPAVLARCRDASADIRKFALDILGHMGPAARAAWEEVVPLLRDGNENVAGAAAETLGRLGEPMAVPHLAACLAGSPWLQCSALQGLSGLAGDEARAALAGIDPASLSHEAAMFLRALKEAA